MLAIIAIAISAMFAAFVVRILIFNTMDDDHEATELLEDTFPTSGDLLFWHLWRVRKKVAPKHRWKVEAYFWLSITGVLVLLIGFGLDRIYR